MAHSIYKILKGILISEETTTPKEIEITPGGTANTKTTIQSSQTTNKILTLPDSTTTIAGLSNKISDFSSSTSAELASKISDETGSGNLVFNTSPIFITDITTPSVIGGTATTSAITYKTTTGVGTTNADHIFQVGNNGATEAMRILNDGKVGINNAAPSEKLHVGGAGASVIQVNSSTATGTSAVLVGKGGSGSRSSYIQFVGDDSFPTYGLQLARADALSFLTHRGSGLFSINNVEAAPMTFSTTNTERLRIKATGELGIGTSTPARLLDINSATGVPAIALANWDVTSWAGNEIRWGGITAAQWNTSTFYTSGSERMRIDSSGNVGIGKTPSVRLSVMGGRSEFAANNDVYSVGFKYVDSSGPFYIGATNSATPDLVFSQTSGVERMRITNGGEVGIGTTPATNVRLHVQESTITGFSRPTATVLELDRNGATNLQINSHPVTIGSISFGDEIATQSGVIAYDHNIDAMYFNTAATERIRILNSGNVGIGNSGPRVKLTTGSLSGALSWNGATTGITNEIIGVNADVASGGNLRVLSSTAQSTDIGGSIVLGGNYSTTASIDFANIAGRKENATDNNTAGYLAFATRGAAGNTTERMRVDSVGNAIVNTAAIATTATDGFLYIPSCAGTPTGTPTTYTGRTPMVYDSTNNKFYIYNGAWKSVTLV